MADEQDEGIGSTFPAPPPFYKHFTSENLARSKELRENAQSEDPSIETSGSATESLQRMLDLPPELRFLIPPEPPTDGKWRNFGGHYDLNDPLPSLGDLRLYPSGPDEDPSTIPSEWTLDRAFYLKKIAKSILINFLDLVGTLSVNPDQFEEKTQDLRVLFINAHHLINQYRPHQARETLILMMEDQVERTRAQVEGVKRMKGVIEGLLKELGNDDPEAIKSMSNGEGNVVPQEEEWEDKQRAIWQALEEELAV